MRRFLIRFVIRGSMDFIRFFPAATHPTKNEFYFWSYFSLIFNRVRLISRLFCSYFLILCLFFPQSRCICKISYALRTKPSQSVRPLIIRFLRNLRSFTYQNKEKLRIFYEVKIRRGRPSMVFSFFKSLRHCSQKSSNRFQNTYTKISKNSQKCMILAEI